MALLQTLVAHPTLWITRKSGMRIFTAVSSGFLIAGPLAFPPTTFLTVESVITGRK
jgi:hypothetical protein